MGDTVKLNTSAKLIAHRGLSGLEPENSVAAFEAAGRRSYHGIETDVHRTADGRFIIIHDDSPARMTGQKGVVEQMTFDQLRSLRLMDPNGVPGNLTLPTLEEYLCICKRHNKASFLELKNPLQPADIASIVDIVRTVGWLERTTFISFDLPNLLCLRALLPDQPLQFLTKKWDKHLLTTLTQHRLGLDIRHTAVNAKLVATCHSCGIPINVWTVDTVRDGQKLVDMGVDFITTNILE